MLEGHSKFSPENVQLPNPKASLIFSREGAGIILTMTTPEPILLVTPDNIRERNRVGFLKDSEQKVSLLYFSPF